jgi:starvation-inducible outer membrane lipoprotein
MNQNQHIARTMEVAHRASCKLMRMGLTVIQVNVGETQPRIEILPGKATGQLESAISIIHGTKDGRRENTKTARLDGALVEWKEPA